MKNILKFSFISLFLFSCSTLVTTGIRSINAIYSSDKSNILKLGYNLKDYEPQWFPNDNIYFERIYFLGAKLELIKNKNKNNNKVIYWAHGGAFLYPLTNIYRNLAEYMVKNYPDYDIVLVDYKQLPDYKYPSGNIDFENGLNWTMNRYSKVFVMGDSAGGNLVVSNTLKRRDNNMRLPNSLVLISPFLDLSNTVESRVKNIKTDLLIGNTKDNFKLSKLLVDNDYFEGFDKKDPYISPIFANFDGFPPTFIEVNEGEILFDDSDIIHKKLEKLGIDNKYIITKGLFHDYIIIKSIPESKEAIKRIFEFLDKQ